MIRKVYFFVLIFIFSSLVYSYPSFIGYGYSSCITCHYNGHGGGALNDYGRALYATEISARDIYSEKTSEEEIAADSGFLRSYPIPWWVRPGVKYRDLWFQNNPGSGSVKNERYINMQTELNLNFFADKKQKLGLITTTAYTVYPRRFSTGTEIKTPFWFAKEYYIRYQYSKTFWIYLGQLDRVFGLRQVDHTAVSRQLIGIAHFDQTQGAVLHWTYPTWDIALNTFFGNGDEQVQLKQKGLSVSGEYELAEKFKIGASGLTSKSDSLQWKIFALHTRMGLSKGSSLQVESGLFEKTSLSPTPVTPVLGGYAILEGLTHLRRGYNLLSVFQYSKSDVKSPSIDKTSLGVGFLTFPLPRTEVRFMAINGKSYNENSASEDNWQLQSQLHLLW